MFRFVARKREREREGDRQQDRVNVAPHLHHQRPTECRTDGIYFFTPSTVCIFVQTCSERKVEQILTFEIFACLSRLACMDVCVPACVCAQPCLQGEVEANALAAGLARLSGPNL